MTVELWPAEGNRHWRLVTDNVMGGISRGTLTEELTGDRRAARMQGVVSTENGGGFIQIAMDLDHDRGFIDAGAYRGICIDVCGNSEAYGVHLRTTAMTRPQQSYRQGFVTSAQWQTVRLPFAQFAPHRIDAPIDAARLRRIGLVAIGRAFTADLAVARLSFY
jgi:Complex I intermediate-associated protein 30 (CIA30)